MKYFKEGKNETGYGDEAIRLEHNIFSVSVTNENKVKIMEECDGYYGKEFTKEDAIAMLEEAIGWIKANAKS